MASGVDPVVASILGQRTFRQALELHRVDMVDNAGRMQLYADMAGKDGTGSGPHRHGNTSFEFLSISRRPEVTKDMRRYGSGLRLRFARTTMKFLVGSACRTVLAGHANPDATSE